MSILGDRIKEYRLKRDITQDEMAEMIGVTRGGYSSYETGKNVPPSDKLVKIADVLKVSTDYLTGRSNEPYQLYSSDIASNSDNELLKKFMSKTETMLRETGQINEEKLSHVMEFMKFVFKDNAEDKK